MGIIQRLHSCVHHRPLYRSFKCVGASPWRSFLTQTPLGPSQLLHTHQTPSQTPETNEELPDDLKKKLFAMPPAQKNPRRTGMSGEKHAIEKSLERRNTFQLLESAVDFYTSTRTPGRVRTLREIYTLLGVRYIDGAGFGGEAGVVDASVESIVGNVYGSSLEIQLRDMAHPRATNLVETFTMAGWRLSHNSQDFLSFVPQLQRDGPVHMDASTNDRAPRALTEPPLLPFRLNISGRQPPERLLPRRRAFIVLYIWLRSYGFDVSTSGLINFWRSCRGLETCSNFVEEFYIGLKALMTYRYFDEMLYNPAGRDQLPLPQMKRITYQLRAIFGREKSDFKRYVELERISASIFGPHICPEILTISPEMPRQLMSEGHAEDGSIRQVQLNRWQSTQSRGTDGPWRENVKRRFEGGQPSRRYTTQAVVEGTAELDSPLPIPQGVQNEDETWSPSKPPGSGVDVEQATRLPDALMTRAEVAQNARKWLSLMSDMRKLSASVQKTIKSLSVHDGNTQAEHLRKRQEKVKVEAAELESLTRQVREALAVVGHGLPSREPNTEELDPTIESSKLGNGFNSTSSEEPDDPISPEVTEILERRQEEERRRREWAELLKGVHALTKLLLKTRLALQSSLSRGGFTSTTPGFANSLAAPSMEEHKARLTTLLHDGTTVMAELRNEYLLVESARLQLRKEARRTMSESRQTERREKKATSIHLKLKQLHQQAVELGVRELALAKEFEALRAAELQNKTGASPATDSESTGESDVDASSADKDLEAEQGVADAEDASYLFANDDDFTPIPVRNETTQGDSELEESEVEQILAKSSSNEIHAVAQQEPPAEFTPVQYDVSPMSSQAQQALRSVQRTVKKAFGPDFYVKAFGSSLYGVTGKDSDLDLVLVDPSNPAMKKRFKKVKYAGLYNLKTVAHVLRQDFNVLEVIEGAKVPIIKFVDRDTGVHVDLNINDRLGYKNSLLLLEYCELSPILRPLLYAIKTWARPRGLSNPSGAFAFKKGPGKYRAQRKQFMKDVQERLSHLPEHTRQFVILSQSSPGSYAYALMTVSFLQYHYLLPNLQAYLPNLDSSKEGLSDGRAVVYTRKNAPCDIRFWVRNGPKGQWYKEWDERRRNLRHPTLDEVLRAWFRYFAFEHDYTSAVALDPKDGGITVSRTSFLCRSTFLPYEEWLTRRESSSAPESDIVSSYLSPDITLDSFPPASAPTDMSAWRSADCFWAALPLERWREYAARRWVKTNSATYVGLYVRDPFDRNNNVAGNTKLKALLQFQRECQLMYAKLLGRPESVDEVDIGKPEDWPQAWTERPKAEDSGVFFRDMERDENVEEVEDYGLDREDGSGEEEISEDIEDTQHLESDIMVAQGDQVLEGEARSPPLDEENVLVEDVDGR